MSDNRWNQQFHLELQGSEEKLPEFDAPSETLGLPFAIAKDAPLVPAGDEWWSTLTDEEWAAWVDSD